MSIQPPVDVKELFPICRLWEKSTRGVVRSWTIFAKDPFGLEYASPTIVREVTDGIRGAGRNVQAIKSEHQANPRTVFRDAFLSQEDFSQLGLGRQFPIAISGTEFRFGFDGTFYSIQLCNIGYHDVTLSWWEDGPPYWQELVKWAEETRKFLTTLLDECEKR